MISQLLFAGSISFGVRKLGVGWLGYYGTDELSSEEG